MKTHTRLGLIKRRALSVFQAIRRGWKEGGITEIKIATLRQGAALSGKNILITGGSKGIGLTIARKCLAEGANVLITGRDASRLESAREKVPHDCLKHIVWDVSDVGQHADKLREAEDMLEGGINVLVNNAGRISTLPFGSVTGEVWDQIYSVNSKGLFFMCQSMSNRWIETKSGGKIINISSSGGFLGASSPYRMTKWDIVGLTQGLGLMLYKHGIIVNGIAPGMTATDMIGLNPDTNVYIGYYPPSYRAALPQEIAELALFLISDASNYIVGQTIVCDGGYSLKS